MTRISGSVELEISARNLAHAIGAELIAQGLADAVADRVLARLHQAATDAVVDDYAEATGEAAQIVRTPGDEGGHHLGWTEGGERS